MIPPRPPPSPPAPYFANAGDSGHGNVWRIHGDTVMLLARCPNLEIATNFANGFNALALMKPALGGLALP